MRPLRTRLQLQQLEQRCLLAADFVAQDLPSSLPQVPDRTSSAMVAADLDGDGDSDWIVSPTQWLQNLGGNFGVRGNEPAESVLERGAEFAPGDLDGDGDVDLVVISPSRTITRELTWRENDGNGNFFSQTTILKTEPMTFLLHPKVLDFDLDGDLDIAYLRADNLGRNLYWHENDGSASFSEAQLVDLPLDDVLEIDIADLDRDGDNDVVVIDTHPGSVIRLVWHENLDANSYKTTVITDTSENFFTSTGGGFKDRSLHLVDLDHDEDLDILVAGNRRDLWLIEFSTENHEFQTPQTVATSSDAFEDLAIVDLDGDGDSDVLSRTHRVIEWFENTDGNWTLSAPKVLFRGEATEAVPFDADGDGDMDIGFSGSGTISLGLIENNGGGSFASLDPISIDPTFGSWRAVSADVNGDGDFDVVVYSTFQGGIAWHANDGSGEFGTRQEILPIGDGVLELEAIDFDRDGDIDLLGQFRWFENMDGQGNFRVHQIDAADHLFPLRAAGDIDADGDIDLLIATMVGEDSIVNWYQHIDGAGTFAPPVPLPSLRSTNRIKAIDVADIDADGDLDLLVTQSPKLTVDPDLLVWYENDDGNWSEHSIAEFPLSIYATVARDFDRDGDLDLILAHREPGQAPAGVFEGLTKIKWLENLGSSFAAPVSIGEVAARFVNRLHVVDFDQDGELDILAASVLGVEIFENVGPSVFSTREIGLDGFGFLWAEIADVDGDRDFDILGANEGVGFWMESVLSASQDEFTLEAETELLFSDEDLLANDSLTAVSIEIVAQAEHGTLTSLPDGDFVYRTETGFRGDDSFSYVALDASGAQRSSPVQVSLTVIGHRGDANGDQKVTLADFIILASNFGKQNALPEEGDFDGNGVIDFSDFLILTSNFDIEL